MLRAIQDTSAYNIGQMRKNMYGDGEGASNGTNGALIKKYNEDVRKMRENEEMLNKFQLQVKKAEQNGSDGKVIEQLKQYSVGVQYKPIGLKTQM